MKRRNAKQTVIVLLAAAALGAAALTGCGDSAESTDTTETTDSASAETADETADATDDTSADTDYGDFVLKIGTASGSLCVAPLHIAEDLGYFDEEFDAIGVDYELVEVDFMTIGDIVASGQIDASLCLAGVMIPQMDSGLETVFTAGLHTGCTKYYVLEDSGIESVADLKGKTIGVPGASDSSTVALKRKLTDEGIGASTENMEVEFTVYNLTDLPLALENGAVDVIALHEPVATQAEEEYSDFVKILDLTTDEKFMYEYCCSSFVTTEVAEEYPEVAAAFTRAVMKAAAYVEANPQETAELQIENGQIDGDADTYAEILESFNYAPDVEAMEQTLINVYEDLVEIGDMTSGADIETFAAEHMVALDGVPNSYTYNDDGTFTEVE